MNSYSDLLKKLEAEESLTLMESHLLDQSLSDQDGVKPLIQSLPEETPSLAWRSQLNERLEAITPTPRRRRLDWRVLTGFGTAVACVAAVLIVVRPEAQRSVGKVPSASVEGSIEQVLLDAHRGAAFTLATGAGDGSTPTGTEATTPIIRWSESDLESF